MSIACGEQAVSVVRVINSAATVACVALGSNLGDRQATIFKAIERIGALAGVRVVAVSGLMENPAVGGPAGSPPFLNGAARLLTTLTPRDLMRALLDIESQLGRVRAEKWGPRTIDLDLILYGDRVIDEPGLRVPHPLAHQRRFVLQPMAEIAGELVHPELGRTIEEVLAELD
jgi:2-amino-4-hydroxy-6-hydroxymethyldihydropteridine diphosphokinase